MCQTDVTSACVAPKAIALRDDKPKEKKDEVFENVYGFTMDLKTEIYAWFNIGGFYVDTSWIGNKIPTSDFGGLYYGIKNLIAACANCDVAECGVTSVGNIITDAIESVQDPFTKKVKVSELTESEHVSKDSINSLDDSIDDDDMPTWRPGRSLLCQAQ